MNVVTLTVNHGDLMLHVATPYGTCIDREVEYAAGVVAAMHFIHALEALGEDVRAEICADPYQ